MKKTAVKSALVLLTFCTLNGVLCKPITNILNKIGGVIRAEVDHVADKVIETAHAVRGILQPGRQHSSGWGQQSRQYPGRGSSHSHHSSRQEPSYSHSSSGSPYSNYSPDLGNNYHSSEQAAHRPGYNVRGDRWGPNYPISQGSYLDQGYAKPNSPVHSTQQNALNPSYSKPNYQPGHELFDPKHSQAEGSSSTNFPVGKSLFPNLITVQETPSFGSSTTDGPSYFNSSSIGNPTKESSSLFNTKSDIKFDLTPYDVDIRSNVDGIPVNPGQDDRSITFL